MSEMYQNKFRIASARLQNWDYGRNADYFITICTKNREHFFGEILNKKMQLNENGKIAEQFWTEIPDRFPFIELGNFVVMPNHIHGILMINKKIATDKIANNILTPVVETRLIAYLQKIKNNPGGFAGDKNPMFHENISRIIRYYKGKCTFRMRKTNIEFAWQSRFHDHIIRDTNAFERIQRCIIHNPSNWKEDVFFTD